MTGCIGVLAGPALVALLAASPESGEAPRPASTPSAVVEAPSPPAAGAGGEARAHYDRAVALREAGDLRGAGKHFAASLALEPRCVTYADFGRLQDLSGREDLARQSYEKAIALAGGCPQARMNLASMLLEDGAYEEAAHQYRSTLAEKPSAEAYSGLGYALNQLGRLEEALAAHDAAVALDSNSALVHRNRALTQARRGAYDSAIDSYRRALAIEPRVSTYYSLAGVLRGAGRKEEADVEYRRGRALSAGKRNRSPRPRDGSPAKEPDR